LKIDLSQDTIYNCHAATPQPIDYESLSEQVHLFNNISSINDRNLMLNNERCVSCEQNCWHIEDKGGISPRLWQKGNIKSHTNVLTEPEIIDLTISNDCNLTCSYCCKEFSKTWLRDIVKNGKYTYTNPTNDLNNRNNVTLRDNITLKIKQHKFKESYKYNALLTQIKLMSNNLRELIITGGDPFVDNDLFDVLDIIKPKHKIKLIIYTGLGVSFSRFRDYLNKLLNNKCFDVHLRISGEGINKHLEFNRYGIKWPEFNTKINYLKQHNISFSFHSSLSNLSIFGFYDFYKKFLDQQITTTFVYTPRMFPIYVMDDCSKTDILTKLKDVLPVDTYSNVVKSITPTPSNIQRINVREFITQFIERRTNISIDIFPKSFLKWIEF